MRINVIKTHYKKKSVYFKSVFASPILVGPAKTKIWLFKQSQKQASFILLNCYFTSVKRASELMPSPEIKIW